MSQRAWGIALTTTLVAGLGAGLVALPANAATTPAPAADTGTTSVRPAGRHAALPTVSPTPQSMHADGPALRLGDRVALVAGATSDPDALSALQTVLTADGVRTVDRVTDPARVRGGETEIFVGGPSVVPSAAAALKALRTQDAASLPAEGYVLADGRVDGHPAVVLDGHDGTGTFYAVQTLRQIIEKAGARSYRVPGVRVRDWPAMPVRGVIEGFYGAPWSNTQRAAQLDFYGRNKMNTYIYSPKDDAYLRAKWREPYPAADLAAIKTLVRDAQRNHVEFTYALSPGLSICYSSPADTVALIAKLQSMWNIGVRSFSIPFDDISYTSPNCAADTAKFGTGGAAAGAEQAYVLNQVQTQFIDTHAGAQPLQMVPTEYYDTSASPYKAAIKADLSSKVIVGWTGEGVIPATITTAQAQQAQAVYGHKILLWDNYPVNDYAQNRLLLGPLVGRDAGLTGALYGMTANPMTEPEASKVALFTDADYMWNSGAYDPRTSWQQSLDALAGPSGAARAALAAFADLNYGSRIQPADSPTLSAKIAAFWPAWEAGDTRAAATLDRYLQVIQGIPPALRASMNDPEFVAEAGPWMNAAAAWGDAMHDAVTMLQDARAGHGAAALAARDAARAAAAKAQTYTYLNPEANNAPVTVTLDGTVPATFVNAALAELDRWLGLSGEHVTAMTSMGTYLSNVPANMIDGNPATYYWSDGSPSVGDYIGVDLGAIVPVGQVTIKAGDAASPNDYLHNAALEYSSDGTTWTTVGTYTNRPDITATLPAGTQARYVRLVATAPDSNWVKVHEFSVTAPAAAQLQVAGAPAAASGSSLAAAADGKLDTVYTAASRPAAGDALTVTLPAARPLARVAVVGHGAGRVQVHTDGQWVTIGSLAADGYTELDARGRTADAIRLAWTAGSAAPTIAEVIPWYAGTPAVALSPAQASVSTSVGSSATLSLGVHATQPLDESGTLMATAPRGLTVQPARSRVDVDRGSQQTVALTARGTVAGTYPVTLTFRPRHGTAVTATVTVTVHPQVGTTNVALSSQGAVATASSVEDGLPQFDPQYANDGNLTTRWSSQHTDDQWLQIAFPTPQNLGKIVIHWQAAYATAYKLEVSADGMTWTTVDDVTDGQGGTETDWITASNVKYLRMQGVTRAAVGGVQYGYSIYELQAYPLVG